jgi:hypothetical protein
MISPQAIFDALELTGAVGDIGGGVTLSELQMLDYLACLLSVYAGANPHTWGFGFSVTDTGAPFARELAEAIESLLVTGWLMRDERVHCLTPAGEIELRFQRGLAPNRWRLRYLRGSASAAVSMPLPAISDALAHEPGLRRALEYVRRKRLLDDTSLELVSHQFAALTEGLGRGPGEHEDLMVPAVVWLTYLARGHGNSGAQAA